MNGMKIAILLVASIGWWWPVAVRAEAPMPKGGCWSREIATRPSVDPQTIATAKGRVIAIDRNNKDRSLAAKEVVTWVRLKTPTGQKSVYLGSQRSLRQQGLNIKVRDIIEVQGIQTYKSKQLPTIIASTVKKSDRVWKIDNIADKPAGVQWCRYNG
jgi:hypothetical protein